MNDVILNSSCLSFTWRGNVQDWLDTVVGSLLPTKMRNHTEKVCVGLVARRQVDKGLVNGLGNYGGYQ